MASDNEDDDLEALRRAALATIRQKEQPIEKVISSVTSSRSHSSPQWSDIPASLDFQEFADPIPEAGPNPLPYGGIQGSYPGGNIRQPAPQFSILRPIQNGMPHPSHPFQYGFRPERRNFPRFPRQSFGNRQDRGNGRLNRQFLPHHGSRRGVVPGGFPHVHRHDHPSNQPHPTANLIFIQPLTPAEGGPISSKSSLPPPAGAKHNASVSSVPTQQRPSSADTGNSSQVNRLSLPQDKYHSSRGSDNGLSSIPPVGRTHEADPPEEVKSKDKFSRYDKSDSEEEDISDVDDIANEIDKVLQDDLLGQQDEEESHHVEEEEEEVLKETISGDDHQPSAASPEPVKPASPTVVEERDLADETSSISELESDSESLDLDALAGGEPILGDLEDLDSLVDTEPNGAVVRNNKNVVGNSSVPSKVPDTDKKYDDEDIEKDVLNINVGDDSFIANNETDIVPEKTRHKSDVGFSSVRQSPQRRLSRSPTYLGRGALSPRRPPDAYRNPHSPPRSRSPFYTKRRSSVSPRRSPLRRSRSPYYKSSLRRSVSPRRRMAESSLGPRRYRSPLRNIPDARRRGNSPRRRSMSPGGRVRSRERPRERTDDRSNHYRDTERERLNRDRYRPQERDKLERPPTSVNSSQPEKPAKGVDRKSPPRKRISPLIDKEPVVDLASLTPEERAKIEARGRKFDGRKEVKLTEVDTKTISLKSIKSREKKQKKKVKSDAPSKKEDCMPVVDKKPTPAGISLKKLRKKQEMKKTQEEENAEKNSPQAVSLADLNDDSEDSEDGRSWKKESTSVTELRIRMPQSQPLPRNHHRSMPGSRERPSVKARRQVDTRRQEKPGQRDRRKAGRVENGWSTDEDDANVGTGSLRSSAVVSAKAFEPDVPPEKLRIQLQIAPQKNKKKPKAHPDFSNVYSVHVKRQHEAVAANDDGGEDEEEERVPVKKTKKKKEKKKKHSKEREAASPPSTDHHPRLEEEEEEASPMSPTKLSIMERLGKKVDLSKKEKKKRKRNRSAEEEGTSDLDLHMMKMKEKNKKILQRQREIQLDKERYA